MIDRAMINRLIFSSIMSSLAFDFSVKIGCLFNYHFGSNLHETKLLHSTELRFFLK